MQAQYSDFVACRWQAREEPIHGMAVTIEASQNEPLASPVARPVSGFREDLVYIVVERQKRTDEQYLRPFGHIISEEYKTFEEAFNEAVNRNRDYALSEEPLKNLPDNELQATEKVNPELAMYAQAGLMVISPDKAEAILTLVRYWEQQGGITNSQEHLVVVDEKAMAAEVNRMCQLSRRTSNPEMAFQRIEMTTPSHASLYVGDRVVFVADYRDEALRDHRGTVLPFENVEELDVQLDNGKIVTVPSKDVAATVELGYAVTVEQARHYPTEHAYVLVEKIGHRQQDVSYTHSHDPTNTRIFMAQEDAGWELAQIAERGISHGEPIHQWWKSQYIESQQTRKQSQQIGQRQSPDLNRDVM